MHRVDSYQVSDVLQLLLQIQNPQGLEISVSCGTSACEEDIVIVAYIKNENGLKITSKSFDSPLNSKELVSRSKSDSTRVRAAALRQIAESIKLWVDQWYILHQLDQPVWKKELL